MEVGGSRYRVARAKGVAMMVHPASSHSLEWRPSRVTSRSEKYPPANTPNDPPRQEASSIQYPRLKVGWYCRKKGLVL